MLTEAQPALLPQFEPEPSPTRSTSQSLIPSLSSNCSKVSVSMSYDGLSLFSFFFFGVFEFFEFFILLDEFVF